MNDRCIITTAFGDRRKNIDRLIKNIRQYIDYPIVIYTSKDSYIGLPPIDCPNLDVEIKLVERLWPHHPRSGQRNGDYYQFLGALESGYSQILYLDDDMYIVDKDFIQGFELAERFGICLPLNPRAFVGRDACIGADVPENDRIVEIPLATAYNCGTMFVNTKHLGTKRLLRRCKAIILEAPMRGPLVIWKAVSRTGIVPYLLPPQWCVCLEDVKCKNPIILHLGHEYVRQYFGLDDELLGHGND